MRIDFRDRYYFSFINNRANSYMGTEISNTFVMKFPNSKPRWQNLF